MANVRTMDDLRREEAGRGVRPTPNPWAGGAAPAQGAPAPNFTPAGGYTPIPDQQSMGGVGAGDVYIDACGETIPVSSCCRQKSTSVKSFMIEGIVPFTLATSNGNVLPVLHRRPLFRKQAKLVCQSDENIHWNHFDNPNLHLHHRSFVEWLGWNSGRAERCALCHGWKGCVKYRSRRILAAHHADYAPCWNFPPCYQRLHSVYVRHPARKGMGRQSNCHYLCCRWSLWQRAVCSLCSVRSFYRLLRISFWSVWSAGCLHCGDVASARRFAEENALAFVGSFFPLHLCLLLRSRCRHVCAFGRFLGRPGDGHGLFRQQVGPQQLVGQGWPLRRLRYRRGHYAHCRHFLLAQQGARLRGRQLSSLNHGAEQDTPISLPSLEEASCVGWNVILSHSSFFLFPTIFP
mmetsp:Transcript_27482/g.72562  ORF Transcript_27482/g.72562 Transcript_27482/m.72562 type:complete len:404 (+) Transcript_27482:73-1284(+)